MFALSSSHCGFWVLYFWVQYSDTHITELKYRNHSFPTSSHSSRTAARMTWLTSLHFSHTKSSSVDSNSQVKCLVCSIVSSAPIVLSLPVSEQTAPDLQHHAQNNMLRTQNYIQVNWIKFRDYCCNALLCSVSDVKPSLQTCQRFVLGLLHEIQDSKLYPPDNAGNASSLLLNVRQGNCSVADYSTEF